MAVKKIMCCCGQGLGSSFMVEMNVQKALKTLGKTEIEVSHGSVSEVYNGVADLFVVGNDIVDSVKGYGDVIALQNIVSIDEVTQKLKTYFEEHEGHA